MAAMEMCGGERCIGYYYRVPLTDDDVLLDLDQIIGLDLFGID